MPTHPFAQLPLALSRSLEGTWAEFECESGNQVLVQYLQNLARQPADSVVVVYGELGAGKSHLLQALCQESNQALYWPMAELQDQDPGILDNVEQWPLVAIDDVDLVAGKAAWEEALFHWFNRMVALGHRCVLSSHTPVQQTPWQLADLRTRFNSGVSFQVQPLSEQGVRRVLEQRCHALGLPLPLEVLDFMLTHYKRDMASLSAMLNLLDYASLSAQRKLTIPFLKQALLHFSES